MPKKSRLQKLKTSQDEPSVWQKWNRRLILIILLCAGGISYKLIAPALQDLREQDAEREGLEGQLRRENQANAELTEEIGWLIDPNDSRYLEGIARDELHLQGEDEKILRLEIEPEPGNIAEETPEVVYGDPDEEPPEATTQFPAATPTR